jgi:hypothetical protein
MPQPSASQVHVNAPLSNISTAYIQSQNDFVCTRVFPLVPVEKQSDVYYVYTKDDWFRDEAAKRAPATESAGSGYGQSTSTYSCDKFSIHKDVPDDVRNNADSVLNPDRDATLFVTQRLLLRQEKQWVTDYFTTGVWTTDITPTFLWSDYANSDPIGDVRTGIVTVQKRTGFKPNKLVVGAEVFIKLIDHPDIVARVGGGSTTGMPAIVNEQHLAAIFGLEEVIVCGAIENTAAEGATFVGAFVQGKHALLVYTPKNPGLLTPAAGYIFFWKGVSGGLGKSIGVKKFRMEQLEADRIEGSISFDDKVVGADLGYFFASVVA